MALLLRTVKQNRWLKVLAEPYLCANDVPADPFADVSTTENLLSVWEVAEDRSNLERIVRAVAVGKQKIDHMGFVVVESALLTRAGIEIRHNRGCSLDDGANDWHRDLVLSGTKLFSLVDAILRHGESGKLLKKRLQDLVEVGIRNKELPEKVRRLLPDASNRSGGSEE